MSRGCWAALEKYRAIAPVFVLDGTNPFSTPWRDLVTTVGTEVGREARAQQLIAELDGRVAELRPRLAERYRGQTAGLASAFGTEETGLVSPVHHPTGAVLDELGLARPPQHRIAEPTLTLSAKELPRVAADHLLLLLGLHGRAHRAHQQPALAEFERGGRRPGLRGRRQAWTVPVPAAIRVVLDDVGRRLLSG